MNESEETETIYDRVKDRLYEMIAQEVKTGEHLLDIGCGECRLINTLAKKTGSKAWGVDIDDCGFAKGMKEAKQLGVSNLIKYMKVDAQFLTSAIEKKFEVTVSVYALHEFKKPVKVLREMSRALKPGGKLLIIDYIKGSTAEKLWSERYFTPEQIQSLLRKAGFNRIETEFPENRELVFVRGTKNNPISLRKL